MDDGKRLESADVEQQNPQEILDLALAWLDSGKHVALATVVETWGSSPRPAGSNLLISSDGSFQGSVSGGCVEGAVISAGQEVIQEGRARTLEFGVTDDEAWEVGLACGGQIVVLIEPIA